MNCYLRIRAVMSDSSYTDYSSCIIIDNHLMEHQSMWPTMVARQVHDYSKYSLYRSTYGVRWASVCSNPGCMQLWISSYTLYQQSSDSMATAWGNSIQPDLLCIIRIAQLLLSQHHRRNGIDRSVPLYPLSWLLTLFCWFWWDRVSVLLGNIHGFAKYVID
jgi:hypothetical protein